MNKILLVSPHFDDAVLSAGQLIAGRPNVDVLTIFGGIPGEELITPYDTKCGFENSTSAMMCRIQEDFDATNHLKANQLYSSFIDNQYRDDKTNIDNLRDSITNYLYDHLRLSTYDFIVGPLGLEHIDHILVSDTLYAINKKANLNIPTYLWEDLPLRVLKPELALERIKKLGLKELEFIGDGPVEDKLKALDFYKSQMGTGVLDKNLMYVPERFWRLS